MIVFASSFRLTNRAQCRAHFWQVYFIEGEVMKTRNTITKLITKTMAVAALAAGLLCGAGWLQPVEAQTGDGSVRFVSYASVGIVHGEKVRLTVGNTAKEPGSIITWTYTVTNSGGVPLYESKNPNLLTATGWFRYSDVSREDLKIEGEPGTGRAEVIVKVTIEAPAGSNPEDSPVSVEVINEATGATSGRIPQHEVGHWMGLYHTFSPEAALIGFIPGERLSFTVLNPPEEGGTPVRAQAYIYDGIGRLTARTAEVDLRPGQSYTFAFNHEDLPLAGEEGTGRKQVRAVVQVAFMDGSVRPFKLPVWVEIVNNRTGSSSGGDYFTGTVTVSGDGD
jgi:hypothetical protein